jgi:hypothetical protein
MEVADAEVDSRARSNGARQLIFIRFLIVTVFRDVIVFVI